MKSCTHDIGIYCHQLLTKKDGSTSETRMQLNQNVLGEFLKFCGIFELFEVSEIMCQMMF